HLETKPERVVHSEAGGHLATSKGWNGADRVLSWLIMGHHAGLTDFSSDEIGAKALEPKMQRKELSEQIFSNIPDCIVDQAMPQQAIPFGADPAFFIRMLFSCLVDADFLDTEAFMNKCKSDLRNRKHPDLKTLLSAFECYMDVICNKAEPTKVNKIRAEILEQCRKAAGKNPCVFSLSVPTGGGKTLSSMAFALQHAVMYDKRRIIYVIPYTSIIEQTADIFRTIPGFENAVVEHHCNVVETNENKESVRNRLAAENWDAPIIVTTSVQFFESLFACRTSRCRKLHNIVESVVIFDEAQCLPPKYLRPVVFAIRELHRHYGVTPLLCTATQPVLTRTEQFDFKFREGFEQDPVQIYDKPDDLAKRLQRINVELYGGSLQPVGYEKVAESILGEGQSVLCIVNRKEDARILAELLPQKQAIHLSTNMCAAHRSQTLDHIRNRLRNAGEPFWVISTSLVEAGVDIDFPVVYRALAGLDSIAQAAGRCNRDGKLNCLGKVVVFVPQKQPDYARQPASITEELLSRKDLSTLLSPANYEAYFRQRFWLLGQQALDEKNILKLLFSGQGMNYYFRTAASQFRFIEDEWQKVVIAPYGKAFELIERLLREHWNEKMLLRKLQRYAVAISSRIFEPLLRQDYIRETTRYPGLFILDVTLYDDDFGFVPPDKSKG
ncbi:MAG: DEAD/DEAH box helicase, partial [Desulfobacterales bacterium]